MDLLAMLFDVSLVWPVNKQIVDRFCLEFLQNEVRLAPNGNIFVKSKPQLYILLTLVQEEGISCLT